MHFSEFAKGKREYFYFLNDDYIKFTLLRNKVTTQHPL